MATRDHTGDILTSAGDHESLSLKCTERHRPIFMLHYETTEKGNKFGITQVSPFSCYNTGLSVLLSLHRFNIPHITDCSCNKAWLPGWCWTPEVVVTLPLGFTTEGACKQGPEDTLSWVLRSTGEYLYYLGSRGNRAVDNGMSEHRKVQQLTLQQLYMVIWFIRSPVLKNQHRARLL